MSESPAQAATRRWYAERGTRLFRNNVGVLLNKHGIPVRYGLANDSPKMNKLIKSGDLIGWTPRLITPDMVGDHIAQFTSIEQKPLDWVMPGVGPIERNGKLTAYGHVMAQLRGANMVRSEGGIAGIMRDPEEGFIL